MLPLYIDFFFAMLSHNFIVHGKTCNSLGCIELNKLHDLKRVSSQGDESLNPEINVLDEISPEKKKSLLSFLLEFPTFSGEFFGRVFRNYKNFCMKLLLNDLTLNRKYNTRVITAYRCNNIKYLADRNEEF